MGQRLFYPPSVAGWPDGLEWLRGPTLLARANFASALTSTYLDPARLRALARRHGLEEPGAWAGALATLWLGTPAPASRIVARAGLASSTDGLGAIARDLLTSPEGQLD